MLCHDYPFLVQVKRNDILYRQIYPDNNVKLYLIVHSPYQTFFFHKMQCQDSEKRWVPTNPLTIQQLHGQCAFDSSELSYHNLLLLNKHDLSNNQHHVLEEKRYDWAQANH